MRNSNSQKQMPKAIANRYTHSTVRLGDLTTPLEKRATSESKAAGRRVTPSAIIKKALRAYMGGDFAQVIEADADSYAFEIGPFHAQHQNVFVRVHEHLDVERRSRVLAGNPRRCRAKT